MITERVHLTGLELDGAPVRLVAAELVCTRRQSEADLRTDWRVYGEAIGPIPEGIVRMVASSGARRFTGVGSAEGGRAALPQLFVIACSDGREIEEAITSPADAGAE